MELFDTLKKITSSRGVSGREKELSPLKTELEKYCTECFYDNANTLHGIFGSDGDPIMLDAHADRIGLLVLEIMDGGFLKIGKCGGIDIRVLPGARVTVHGTKEILGVISSVPPHLIDSKDDDADSLDKLFVDTGLSREELEKEVRIGDSISVNGDVKCLSGSLLEGAALDDRVGCLAILVCLDILKKNNCKKKVVVSFSSMEEVGGLGAKACAFDCKPESAIAVDVSFAVQKGVEKSKAGTLGGGPMICISPTISYEMSNTLIALAKEKSIPYQLEVCGGETGTNADEIASSRAGVKTGLVSIPQKNMHTAVEICDLKDIENVGRLLAEYVLTR